MKSLIIDVEEVLNTSGMHKFYRWLANQFDGAIILEAGTSKGNSAKSWACNPNNLVITYDIEARAKKHLILFPNILYKVLDVNKLNLQWFSKVDIVYLDINHNGYDEERFLEGIDSYFKGILIMDDINCAERWCKLYDLFHNLDREHHLLPSSIGASRGTGVVPYGDWTIEIKGDLK